MIVVLYRLFDYLNPACLSVYNITMWVSEGDVAKMERSGIKE
jgi:hypothetical protein